MSGPKRYDPKKRDKNGYLKSTGKDRPSFAGGVWVDELPLEPGDLVKKWQIPEEYWKQPEMKIPLKELPTYWEHNKTQFTPQWQKQFTARLTSEWYDKVGGYEGLGIEEIPEMFPERERRLYENNREEFYTTIQMLEAYPFMDRVPQKDIRPTDALVGGFKAACGASYEAWLSEQDDFADEWEPTRFEQEQAGLRQDQHASDVMGFDVSKDVDTALARVNQLVAEARLDKKQVEGQERLTTTGRRERVADMTLDWEEQQDGARELTGSPDVSDGDYGG